MPEITVKPNDPLHKAKKYYHAMKNDKVLDGWPLIESQINSKFPAYQYSPTETVNPLIFLSCAKTSLERKLYLHSNNDGPGDLTVSGSKGANNTFISRSGLHEPPQ